MTSHLAQTRSLPFAPAGRLLFATVMALLALPIAGQAQVYGVGLDGVWYEPDWAYEPAAGVGVYGFVQPFRFLELEVGGRLTPGHRSEWYFDAEEVTATRMALYAQPQLVLHLGPAAIHAGVGVWWARYSSDQDVAYDDGMTDFDMEAYPAAAIAWNAGSRWRIRVGARGGEGMGLSVGAALRFGEHAAKQPRRASDPLDDKH